MKVETCERLDLASNILALSVQRLREFKALEIMRNANEKSIHDDYVYWAVLDSLLFTIIVIGNILTILAIRMTRTLREVASNLFVLNLAISDLMVGLTLPYYLAFYIDENLGHHKTTCVMRFVTMSLACSSSMYSLLSIAIDRYVAVVHPLEYARKVTTTTVLIVIFAGWSIAIAISTVPIYWNCFAGASECEFETVLPKVYIVAIVCPLICLTWIAMFTLYWRIWLAAKSHTRRLRETGYDNHYLHDCKGAWVVLSVLGCFSICWLPYLILEFTRLFNFKSTGILYQALFSLAIANSGMNPIIYAWKNSQFRKAFGKLLRFKGPDENDFNKSLKDYQKRQRELKIQEENSSKSETTLSFKNGE